MPAVDRDKRRGRKQMHDEDTDSKPLGVNKLKSQIRQVRRLLGSDKLTPDVRVETERKLAALELDLENATRNKLEASRATRYHHVKFFERQKVIRRLKQVLREIEKGKAVEGDREAAKEAKRLKKELQHLRIDLNYILHYPKALKYVSLYPDGEYAAHTPADDTNAPVEEPSTKDPTEHRARMRRDIAKAMEDGSLSQTPEETLSDSKEDEEGATSAKTPSVALKRDKPIGWREGRTAATAKAAAPGKAEQKMVEEEDDFFAS